MSSTVGFWENLRCYFVFLFSLYYIYEFLIDVEAFLEDFFYHLFGRVIKYKKLIMCILISNSSFQIHNQLLVLLEDSLDAIFERHKFALEQEFHLANVRLAARHITFW